jgi:hypothetical protein
MTPCKQATSPKEFSGFTEYHARIVGGNAFSSEGSRGQICKEIFRNVFFSEGSNFQRNFWQRSQGQDGSPPLRIFACPPLSRHGIKMHCACVLCGAELGLLPGVNLVCFNPFPLREVFTARQSRRVPSQHTDGKELNT